MFQQFYNNSLFVDYPQHDEEHNWLDYNKYPDVYCLISYV